MTGFVVQNRSILFVSLPGNRLMHRRIHERFLPTTVLLLGNRLMQQSITMWRHGGK
jgi:hypothetical protein